MKYVLITGANGGMGNAAVKAFEKAGYGVFALDKSEGEARENVFPLVADITDERSVATVIEKIKQTTDELFAVVHYAGLYMLDSLIEMPSEAFEKIFYVNLFGAYYVNKAVMPLLKKDSRIIMTTSELATLDPLPFTGIYAVSKAALDKYAYSLAMEVQLLGVYVSVLRAGAVKTNMLGASTAALEKFCEKTALYKCNAERFRKIVNDVEAKSVTPEKIAQKTLKILAKKRPAFAYSINRNGLLLLLNALPKRMQMSVIRKILK